MHQRWRIDADVLYGWTTVVRDRKDFPTNVVTREHIEGFPIELRLGPARESLRQLAAEGSPAFDFVFIDADKPGYPEYLELTLPLCRNGTMIIADNMVRDGAVADAASVDPSVRAVREYNARLAADPRLDATVIQTVGSKGYDGFTIALVTGAK